MKRRKFIQLTQAGSLGIILAPSLACSVKKKEDAGFQTTFLRPVNYLSPALSEGNRVAFGWPSIGILPGESVILKPEQPLQNKNLWFRVAIAQEMRDIKLLHLHLPETGELLGTVDIRFSSVLVPYEVEIDKKYAEKISKQGIKATLESKSPLWFFSGNTADNSLFPAHILSSSEKKGSLDDFFNCFLSVNSIQAFGWREGTVLDGLWQIYDRKKDKRALETIQKHFDLFFDEQQNLIYENAGSKPNDNEINGIESTIPFATLARIKPEHPILKTVVNGWQELEKEDGAVIDGGTVSAEGCYTVAYPMAVIGKAWNDDDLKKDAIAQLKHRFVLINNNELNLRYHREGENYTYPNWARGAAWTLLGFSRTISELKDEFDLTELIEKFEEAVKIAVSMQRENGLWNCFMHQPDSLPDTSGSAGISAAILTGINNGFLSDNYRLNAEKCWTALQDYITPDGLLKGVAQDNRGGVELQESDYRVIAQMGMGMMAQLYAEL